MSDDASSGSSDGEDVLSPLAVAHDPAAAVIAICAAITVICVFFAYIG